MFTQHIYQAFTRGFNDLLLANIVGTIWFSVPLMTGLSMSISNLTVYCAEIFVVALLTQVFYCYRVAILTKSKCAVAIIIMVRDTAQEFAVFDYFSPMAWGTTPALYRAARSSYSNGNANKSS